VQFSATGQLPRVLSVADYFFVDEGPWSFNADLGTAWRCIDQMASHRAGRNIAHFSTES
jgi:hypothetical protein